MSDNDKLLKEILSAIDSLPTYMPSVDLDELTELLRNQNALLTEIRDAVKAR
jgi:hypothetical protein